MISANCMWFNICDALTELCKKKSLAIDVVHEKEALFKARQHMLEHNKEFFIAPKTPDVYKFVSWYGYFLSHTIYDPKRIVYLVTIQVLNEILSKESCSQTFSPKFVNKLYQMLSRDSQGSDFSIGKNGLYVAFRSDKDICQQCNKEYLL